MGGGGGVPTADTEGQSYGVLTELVKAVCIYHYQMTNSYTQGLEKFDWLSTLAPIVTPFITAHSEWSFVHTILKFHIPIQFCILIWGQILSQYFYTTI